MSIITGGFLQTKKTLITAIVSVISCVAAYLVGDVGLVDLLQVVIPLFGVIFLGQELSTTLTEKIDSLNSKKK